MSRTVFCVYYIIRGVLQENRQELVAFMLSVLILMIRSVVNFSVVGTEGKQELLVGVDNSTCICDLVSNKLENQKSWIQLLTVALPQHYAAWFMMGCAHFSTYYLQP